MDQLHRDVMDYLQNSFDHRWESEDRKGRGAQTKKMGPGVRFLIMYST